MHNFHLAAEVGRLEARVAALELQVSAFLPEHETAAQPAEEEDAAWLRGKCPLCGKAVASRTAYVDGKGFLIYWTCVGAEEEPKSCLYRRIL